MKTLLLLRHAKSSWDDPGLRDFDRPLANRGRRAAPAMGAYMASQGLVPELVLCSTARRAQETWALVGTMFDPKPQVVETDLLYGAGPGRMLEEVRLNGRTADSVMIVAHNPGTEDLALALAGSGPDRELARMQTKFPTCSLAVIDLDVASWDDASPGKGILRRFVRPKDLDGS